MGRPQKKVNWDSHNKQWIKTYKGKRYYLGTGYGSSDRESRRIAVERMEEIKKRVDAGELIDTAKDVPARKQKTKKKTKKKTVKRIWNPKLVRYVINRFLKDKMHTATSTNGEDLTYGRVQNLKNRLQHFNDYFGDRRLSSLTANDITRWSQVNSKRVEKGEIAPSTLRQDFVSVKQLFRYAYKQELINKYPAIWMTWANAPSPNERNKGKRNVICSSLRKKCN